MNTISPEDQDRIEEAVAAYREAGGLDWVTVSDTLLASTVDSFSWITCQDDLDFAISFAADEVEEEERMDELAGHSRGVA